MLRVRGDNKFGVEHAESTKRQRRGELARVVEMGREAHGVTLVW